MENQSGLNRLRWKLLLRGMPPAYVERVVREVSEHRSDLVDEIRSDNGISVNEREIDQRLGDMDQLADAIVARMRNNTFAGRHPYWSFICRPVLGLTLVGSVLLLMMTYGLELYAGWIGADVENLPGQAARPVFMGLYYLLKYALPAAIAYGVCVLARRSFCGYKWAVIGCAALTFFLSFWFLSLNPGEEGQARNGEFRIGVTFPYPFGAPPDILEKMPPQTVRTYLCYFRDVWIGYAAIWHHVPLMVFGMYYLVGMLGYGRERYTAGP